MDDDAKPKLTLPGQVVLVFQGGGALGRTREVFIRRYTKPASSQIGSSAPLSARLTAPSSPAMNQREGSLIFHNFGIAWSESQFGHRGRLR